MSYINLGWQVVFLQTTFFYRNLCTKLLLLYCSGFEFGFWVSWAGFGFRSIYPDPNPKPKKIWDPVTDYPLTFFHFLLKKFPYFFKSNNKKTSFR